MTCSVDDVNKVFDTALEACVRWCAPGSDDKAQGSDDVGLPGDNLEKLVIEKLVVAYY